MGYQPGLIELATVPEQPPLVQMAAVKEDIDAMADSISAFNELYFTGDQKKEVIEKVKHLYDKLGKLSQEIHLIYYYQDILTAKAFKKPFILHEGKYHLLTPDWYELSYYDECTLKIKFSLDKGGTYDTCIDGYTDLYDGNETIEILDKAFY